ncbi:hypothetical protein FACS1894198_5840 [Clostridia bacterium]|nr:hypothetical protein FACS1894198_5840 [Clostridia bacterium]
MYFLDPDVLSAFTDGGRLEYDIQIEVTELNEQKDNETHVKRVITQDKAKKFNFLRINF